MRLERWCSWVQRYIATELSTGQPTDHCRKPPFPLILSFCFSNSMQNENHYSLTANKDCKEKLQCKSGIFGWSTTSCKTKSPTKSKQYGKTDSDCGILADKSESALFCCAASFSIWVLAHGYHDEYKHYQVEGIEKDKGSNQANIEG